MKDRKVIHYEMWTDDDCNRFSDKINELLERGYILHGLTYVKDGVYAQAVVKYEDDGT